MIEGVVAPVLQSNDVKFPVGARVNGVLEQIVVSGGRLMEGFVT